MFTDWVKKSLIDYYFIFIGLLKELFDLLFIIFIKRITRRVKSFISK